MDIQSLRHHFLVATPNMSDNFFSESVVYICEHSEEGTMGLVVNVPTQFQMHHILSQLNIEVASDEEAASIVFAGGPVEQSRGFVLFEKPLRRAGRLPGAVHIEDGIHLSASTKTLKALAAGKLQENHLVTLGFASWGPGQLLEEIMRDDWMIAPFNRDLLFNVPPSNRHEFAARLIGVELSHMSALSGHA